MHVLEPTERRFLIKLLLYGVDTGLSLPDNLALAHEPTVGRVLVQNVGGVQILLQAFSLTAIF